MTPTTAERPLHMGRKKSPPLPAPEQPPSGTTTVKVNRELARIASVVADWKGVEKQEYIDSILRASVLADYDDYLRDQSARYGKGKGGDARDS